MKTIYQPQITEEKVDVQVGDTIAYLDENDKLQKSVVTESNLNWVRKNIGERVFLRASDNTDVGTTTKAS